MVLILMMKPMRQKSYFVIANIPHENLTFGEALNTERYYGDNLKSKSCGTWWN